MLSGDTEACHKLRWTEWLREVVVCPVIECAYFVVLLSSSGKHDDGYLRPFAKAPEHLEPVDAGESEVENDDVGRNRRPPT